MGVERFCTSCGQALVPGSRFCGRCGHRVEVKRGGLWKLGFVMTAAVAAGALLWIFVLREKPAPRMTCKGGLCPAVTPARGGDLDVDGTGTWLDKVRVRIGPGALKDVTDVKIAPAPADATPPRVADPWQEAAPTLTGPIVRFEPDGLRFTEPVTVTLPFDPTLVPPGRAVVVLTWGGGHAERLEPTGVDPDDGLLEVRTTHFSDAAVALDPGRDAIFVGMTPIDAPLLGPTENTVPGGECDSSLTDVKASVAAGKYRVYNDPSLFWGERGIHPGDRTMLWYLYAEDGGAMSSIVTGADQPIQPIRTGHEVALFNLLKEAIRGGARPTPEAILDLALRAVARNGSANYADAIVTAHNVVRAIARADKWWGDLIDMKGRPCPPEHVDCGFDPKVHTHFGHPPSDPMMPIFRDLLGAQSTDGGNTFLEMIGGKPGRGSAQGVMQAFDPDKGVFARAGTAGNYVHNGGAHYYHWVGAVAQVFHGAAATTFGAGVEFTITKLPSDPTAGVVQTTELMRGRSIAACVEARPPQPPPPPEPPPCPPVSPVVQKCPWTPDGYTVGECSPGFCWDGGPQGSLACKQIETPAGAGRNDLNNIICPDGTVPLGNDRCTGLHLGCGPASVGPTPTTP